MASDKVKRQLVEKLAELKADNPVREDWFRLSKSGDSIAFFETDREQGTILYSTYLDDERMVYALFHGKDGNLVGLAVDRQLYEGFPDPPRTECRFQVGDRVRTDWAGGRAGRVVEVRTSQGYDRNWSHRVVVSTRADGRDTFEAHENAFMLDAAEVALG